MTNQQFEFNNELIYDCNKIFHDEDGQFHNTTSIDYNNHLEEELCDQFYIIRNKKAFKTSTKLYINIKIVTKSALEYFEKLIINIQYSCDESLKIPLRIRDNAQYLVSVILTVSEYSQLTDDERAYYQTVYNNEYSDIPKHEPCYSLFIFNKILDYFNKPDLNDEGYKHMTTTHKFTSLLISFNNTDCDILFKSIEV